MSSARQRPEGDGLLVLVRETLDGIGRLVGEHMKLARLEVQADIRAYGRSLTTLLLVVGIFALAYCLACVGLALVLARWVALPTVFFLLAGAHVVAGAVVGGVAITRLRSVHPLRETAHELERSVTALTSAGASHDGATITLDGTNTKMAPSLGAAEGGAWPTTRP
jgi:Putative Actinobacterial Holin-X, holin superfamily III